MEFQGGERDGYNNGRSERLVYPRRCVAEGSLLVVKHVPQFLALIGVPTVILSLFVGTSVFASLETKPSVKLQIMSNWIMGELVRVYHGLSIMQAQQVVDALAEVRVPAVWSDGSVKRVLQPSLKLPDQILLLVATSLPSVTSSELIQWTEAADKRYFMKLIQLLHNKKRFIEFTEGTDRIQILPPGAQHIQQLVRSKNLANII